MLTLKTIDAHAAGEPLRLIVDGFPSPRGATMLEKREWVKRHADHLRRALMLEPRGHADMYGAVLTEPVAPGSHAGVLFMHNEGYSTMCGHGVIAVTTIALERGLLMLGRIRHDDAPASLAGASAGHHEGAAASVVGDRERAKAGGRLRPEDAAAGLAEARGDHERAKAGDEVMVVLDSPAGVIRARARIARSETRAAEVSGAPGVTGTRAEGAASAAGAGEATRVESVAFQNVPSFVLHAGLPVKVGARTIRADVAFGGAFYAIVDSESV